MGPRPQILSGLLLLASCHLVSGHADLEPRRRADAELCGRGEECESGFCVDGLCCAELCNGICETCREVPGVCVPHAAKTDPDGECGEGVCDGVAACASGAPQLSLRLGVGRAQSVDDVAASPDGRVWVTGRYEGAIEGIANARLGGPSQRHPYVATLDGNGELLDALSLNGEVAGEAGAPVIAAGGERWFVGFTDLATSERVIVARDGSVQRRPGALRALAAAADGTLYATASATSVVAEREIVVRVDTIADTEEELLGVTTNGARALRFGPHSVAVSDDGDVVVAGAYRGPVSLGNEELPGAQGAFAASISPSTGLRWLVDLERAEFDDPLALEDHPVVVAVDAAGDVIVGTTDATTTSVVRLDAEDGYVQWTRTLEGRFVLRDAEGLDDVTWLVGMAEELVTLGAVRIEPGDAASGAWLGFDDAGDVVGHRVFPGAEVTSVGAAGASSWRVGGRFRLPLTLEPLSTVEPVDEDGFVVRWDDVSPTWVRAFRDSTSEVVVDDLLFDAEGFVVLGRFERTLRVTHPQGEIGLGIPAEFLPTCPRTFVARFDPEGRPTWAQVAEACVTRAGTTAVSSDEDGVLVTTAWPDTAPRRWAQVYPPAAVAAPVDLMDAREGVVFLLERGSGTIAWHTAVSLGPVAEAGPLAIDARGEATALVGGATVSALEAPRSKLYILRDERILGETELEEEPPPEARWVFVGEREVIVVERVFRGIATDTIFTGFDFAGEQEWRCVRPLRALDVSLAPEDRMVVLTDEGLRIVRPRDCIVADAPTETVLAPPDAAALRQVGHDGTHTLVAGAVEAGTELFGGTTEEPGWSLAKLAGTGLSAEDLLFERFIAGDLASDLRLATARDGRIAMGGGGTGTLRLGDEELGQLQRGDAWIVVVGP